MKLFQQLLVATASIGLIAPISAQASDAFNLEEMNNYSSSKKSSSNRYFDSKSFVNEVNDDLATLKESEQGIESYQNSFEAGSFSDTTTLDSKVIFTLGDASDEAGAEGPLATYSFTGNLNTSFTGDDNLYVRLKTGNSASWTKSTTYGTYLSSSKGNGDDVKVDKIWYEFPVRDNYTVWVGPKIENYYMHGTTPSIYKPVTKQFTLGGNGAAYGASTNPGFGVAYKNDNGFAISSNAVSKEGDASGGWGTDNSATSWATQIGYTKPNYSASFMVNRKTNGWVDSYYSTKLSRQSVVAESTNYGVRAWWRPDDSGTAVPSVSLGYDFSDKTHGSVTGRDTTAYFAGLTWQDAFTPDDRIGIAFGQPEKRDDESTDPFAWEAYYSYQVNDSVTVTPAVFGTSDRNGTGKNDVTGAVVETTFKF